ncbi:Helicase associated domain protein [Streptomyces sp. NPDC021056]|uniref:Helicase associated domain protein n=1 Tax=Streptomyces sp. NPDC021056 TaxID=3155012 RepID=UPI0033EA8B2D
MAAKALTTVGRPLPSAVETLATANDHILGETFHSMAALRYGDHVAKMSATPRSAYVKALTGSHIDKKADESALRDFVIDFFADNSAEYDIRAQLCANIGAVRQSDQWATNLAAARQFHAREGHLHPARKHVELVDGEEIKLGSFLDDSRRRAAKLPAERCADLDVLGMRW